MGHGQAQVLPPLEPEQTLLFPLSPADWLPDNHLVLCLCWSRLEWIRQAKAELEAEAAAKARQRGEQEEVAEQKQQMP